MNETVSARHFLRRAVSRIFTIVVVALCIQTTITGMFHHNQMWPYDLRAIYCGWHVTAEHGDPYLVEPLKSCELGLGSVLFAPLPAYALPAPLPPYAQLLFAPIGALPPDAAFIVFSCLIAAATILAVVELQRLCGVPWDDLIAPILLGVYFESLWLGQVTPLCFAAIVCAARAVKHARYDAAALWLLPAFIQPQLGISIVVAAFAAQPAMRMPLLRCVILPLAVATAAQGARTLEYLDFLHYHSLAELHQLFQLSCSFFLAQLGVPATMALQAGAIASLLWIALAAVSLRRLGPRDPLIIALPAALAVLPGTFEHPLYLEYAIPCAYIVLMRSKRDAASALGIALQSVVTFPWTAYFKTAIFSVLSICAAVKLAWTYSRGSAVLRLGLCIAMLVFFVEIGRAVPQPDAPRHPHAAVHFASQEWLEYTGEQTAVPPIVWMQKIPHLLAVFLIAGATLVRVWRTPPTALNRTVSDLGEA